MLVKIETYYDFRSPYAYFADYRIRKGDLGFPSNVEWVGRPMFIDVTLNLQLGKEPWAPFVDTLIPPKRAYLNADIRRMADFYGAPCKPFCKSFYKPARSWPSYPDQIPALCVASLLSGQVEQAFRSAIFDG